MLHKNFCKTSLTALSMASAIAFAPASNAALGTYAQDFESMNTGVADGSDPSLTNDGWVTYVNRFEQAPGGGPGAYRNGYFGGTAPNGGGAFSAVVAGEGGPVQEAQQLSIYSNYNDADQVNAYIEANVFREYQGLGASDYGTWTFTFDTKQGNINDPEDPLNNGGLQDTTALAFIKTLNPNAGFATTNFLTVDTTALGFDWGTYSIDIDITSALDGQFIQFGFASTASRYEESGVFYDNVCFNQTGICDVGGTPEVPVPAAVWLFGSGLLGLVGVARRKSRS